MAGEPVAYVHGHHESVLRSHRWRTAENSAAHLLPYLRSGMRLLDVGCGPGTITVELAARVAPGRTTALEYADDALDLARAEAERRGATGIDFVVGDVQGLEFADGCFDVTHAHQVLHHVPDPVRALREMARVTRPGGVVAVRETDYAAKAWYPRLPALEDWMALFQRCARAHGAEPDAGRHLLAWAHAAGLTDVRTSTSTWCFATPEDRAWWGGMWAERILDSAIARQALDSGFATRAELAAISAAWREWAAHPDGFISLLHGEILARV